MLERHTVLGGMRGAMLLIPPVCCSSFPYRVFMSSTPHERMSGTMSGTHDITTDWENRNDYRR
jgi:hypothetical protein